MSYHILKNNLRDLDHKLTENQDLESIKVSNTPPHILSTATSPCLVECSSHTAPDKPSSVTKDQDLTLRSTQSAQAKKSETDTATTLHLRPEFVAADQERWAAVEPEKDEDEDEEAEHSRRFQSPNFEDEDFYGSHSAIAAPTVSSGYLSDSSPKPFPKSRSQEVQTSPATEGCACGSPWQSPPSPGPTSSLRFLSKHKSAKAVSSTHTLPAELKSETLPAETYVPCDKKSAASSTDNSGLSSGATPSTLPPIPPAPADSTHEELAASRNSVSGSPANTQEPKGGQKYTGHPGSTKEWPHYDTPVVEGENLVKCYGKINPATGEATEFEHKTTLPRSQSSGWLEGKLDRASASSSSIHANVENIDDMKRCPAAQGNPQASASPQTSQHDRTIEAEESDGQEAELDVARERKIATAVDPELQDWIWKRNMMFHELRQIDTHHPAYHGPNTPMALPRTDTGARKHQVQDAQQILNAIYERGFQHSPSWKAQHNRLLKLAKKATAYPFLAFALGEFGKFFSLRFGTPNEYDGTAATSHLYKGTTDVQQRVVVEGPASGRGGRSRTEHADGPPPETEEERDMARAATLQGTIDGCAACMRMMAFVGPQPSPAWRRQYAALLENAYERGEVEPLVEFVRQESERVGARNASIRAAEAATSEGLIGGSGQESSDNLDDLSLDSVASVPISSDEGYKAYHNEPQLLQLQGSSEYAAWLLNTITEADRNNDLVFWIANPWIEEPSSISQLATPGEHETRKPFQVILGELINHQFEPGFGLYALAVKITIADKPESWSIYADVRMQDNMYHERLVRPIRVQCFGVHGGVYDIDMEAIIAELNSIREERAGQNQSSRSERGRSANSGKIVRHQVSDVFPQTVAASDIRLTTANTRTPHANVFSDKGIILVALEDFPEIPEDAYPFVPYQLQVGEPPSTIFVNCERCHKPLASFENVEEGPTVARRAEGELGDVYIVTAISSLNNVIGSIDRVKQVWVRVGAEKYFMRANEAGVPRTHDCASVQGTIRAELQQNRELARYHWARLEHRRSGYSGLCALPSHNYPMRRPRFPALEPAARPQVPIINMPASIQFIPIQNFPTAELTSNPPCTVIAVDERCGTIHGVYQGVVGYRAILGGANEPCDTITLNIRDGLGHFVGILTRVKHFEVAIVDGQTHEFTAPAHADDTVYPHHLAAPTTAEMNAHPPCLVTSICERSRTIHGVYQGVTGYRCTFRPAGELGDTVSLDVRDPFGAFLAKLTRVRHYEVAVMNGEIVGFTAQDEIVELAAPQNNLPTQPQQTGLKSDVTPSDESVFPGDGRFDVDSDSDPDLALRGGGDEECPMMRAAKTDWVVRAETTHGAPLNPQALEFTPRSVIQPPEAASNHPRLDAIETANTSPLSNVFNEISVVADRIPPFLQPTGSMGPATNDSEPVFSEEYKEWLRGLYTRPSNNGCATNTAPGPSFQDFWNDREAGRPATAADGSIVKDEREELENGVISGKNMEEYIPLRSDDGDKAQARARHGHGVGTVEDPIMLSDNRAETEPRHRETLTGEHGQTPQAADVDETGPAISQNREPRLYMAQPAASNPQVVRIVERFLHEQAVKNAREAYEAALRRD